MHQHMPPEETNEQYEDLESAPPEGNEGMEIAIVGMAGKFPGAKDLHEFWTNICNGVESITFFSEEELLESGISQKTLSNPHYIKAASVLDKAEWFDAGFFKMPPREAEITDPQHRLFLECAWHALEDAGYTPQAYQGNIGVFGGASTNGYIFNVISDQHTSQTEDNQQLGIGNNLFALSTRVSYKLNLHGPSLSVHTACSTGLVATHLACQSLLSYQCDMALAGAASLKILQHEGYTYQTDGIASPDGHTRTFDNEARGTVFGSGVGVVVLKRMEDALASGDTIYAVIKGSALNNDGSAKMSYTAPSVDGQVEVIMLAQGLAGVDPETISYVEAHGTATPMGDPIEVTALTQAFRLTTEKKQFCALGSVKSNIGHLDAAAGMAGLIKTALMLKHRQIAPSINCEHPTSGIDWANSPFYVNTQLKPWPDGTAPRRAGVSAFGYGGTNAHVILEEARKAEAVLESGRAAGNHPPQLIILSAHTPSALDAATEQLASYLEEQEDGELADVAYTLQTGRTAFEHRRMLVARMREDAITALRQRESSHPLSSHIIEEREPPIAFLFPGQGTQYIDMAKNIYEEEATFRDTLNRCAELLTPEIHVNLLSILYPDHEQRDWATELLDQTRITQPVLFSIEYALAQQWIAWGIQPQALLGHSIGEYVSACLSGVMSLEDALHIVALRGQLVQQQPAGTMLSVLLSQEEIQPLLRDYTLDLAAINGPQQCVVSGPSDSIEKFETLLTGKHISSKRLRTSHAFHSAMMDPATIALTQALRTIPLHVPETPFISNVTGTWITDDEATDPHYWGRQLRLPVQFASGVEQLFKDSSMMTLEVGPGQTLSRLAMRQAGDVHHPIIASLRSAQENRNDHEGIVTAIGKLWLAGASVHWNNFWEQRQRRHVSLPGYPFERHPYWISGNNHTLFQQSVQAVEISKRNDLADWFYVPGWKRADRIQRIQQHSVKPQNWLILADRLGIGQRLAEKLQAVQHQAFLLYPGSEFAQLTEAEFEVRPGSKVDFARVMESLIEKDFVPQGFIYLWNLGELKEDRLDIQQFAAIQEKGLYSLLPLLQAYTTATQESNFSVFLITENLFEVIGNEPLHAEQAPLKAVHLVLSQEYPGAFCQHIDIQTLQIENLEMIGQQLVREIVEPQEGTSIALRGKHRWIETFNVVKQQEEDNVLRSQGVYLIVGGLGQVGFLIASDLAQKLQARLILVDKKDLAAQGQAEQKAQIENLRLQGAEVEVIQADATNPETMKHVLAEIQQRWQALHGVIFAPGDALPLKGISETTREDLQAEFAARVEGLLALEEALAHYHLDFCLIVSSLASILGGLGHLAYAAANVFMDAFVLEHNQHSNQCWTSINWETWNLKGEKSQVGLQRLQLAMDSTEVISTFKRALGLTQTGRIIISSGDLFQRIQQWTIPTTSKLGSNKAQQVAALANGQSVIRNTGMTPGSKLEQEIAQLYSELLGIEQIGLHENFFELGGDSLLAVQLIALLRQKFQSEFSLRAFFEAPTVFDVAQKLQPQADALSEEEAERILREIEQLSEEEAQALLLMEEGIEYV